MQDLPAQPRHRVVPGVDRPLLQRDDGVVGDLDVLGAHLGAALGDVALAQALLLLQELTPVVDVERVHLELRRPCEEAGAGEGGLVLLVVADHMAHVLAQVALDALAELLTPFDIDLLHPVPARLHLVGRLVPRAERGDPLGHLVVVGHVGDQVPEDGKRPHGGHGDRLPRGQGVHPRHAHEGRPAVDLGGARAALAGLAVPATGQVGCVGCLYPVDDIEDHLALLGGHHVLCELPTRRIPTPQAHGDLLVADLLAAAAAVEFLGHQVSSSNNARRSSGMTGIGSGVTVMQLIDGVPPTPPRSPPPGMRWTKLIRPISATGLGKSSRV